MYADDDDDPHVCVRDVIRKYLAQFKNNNNSGTAAIIKDNIVKDILDQKFLFYRAHWGMSRIPDDKSRIWKPLEQSWFSFIQLGTASQDLHVWFSQRNPLPALEEHRSYLLRQAI